MQALELARQQDAGIKDEIHHELANCMYALWQQESQARKAQHARLRAQLGQWLASGSSAPQV